MEMLTLQQVTRYLEPVLVARSAARIEDLTFTGVAIDSRRVSPGELFLALPGERHDGHQFLAEAVSRGARGLVVSRPVVEPYRDVVTFQVSDTLQALQRLGAGCLADHPGLQVIGVTGSVGKTTCKELIASVLSARYRVLKSTGNLNTEIGLPLSLAGLEAGHQAAVLEMGMTARGDIALLCRIAPPCIGVVTSIAPVHLERLGSLGAIAAAKGELLEALPPDGVAIVNGDSPWAHRLAARTRARVVFYGLSPQCQVRGEGLESHGLDGISFYLCARGERVPVRSPMPGRHNLHNLLAAAAVALEMGMTLEEVASALACARTDLRLRVVEGPRGSTIIDDSYNASPPSVLAALDLLGELPGRRLALLGDMRELGPADEEGHRQVGVRAAATTDVLLLVGERAPLMAEAAREAGHRDVRVLLDKEEAAALLARELQPGDYLLVKASRALALETVVEALRP